MCAHAAGQNDRQREAYNKEFMKSIGTKFIQIKFVRVDKLQYMQDKEEKLQRESTVNHKPLNHFTIF